MAKLLPQKVNLADRKVKVAIYGPSQTGKSYSALTFPKVLPLNGEGGFDALLDRPEFRHITSMISFDPRSGPAKYLEDFAQVIEAVYAGDPDYPCGSLAIDSATMLQTQGNKLTEDRPKNVGEWGARNFRVQKAMDTIYGPAPVHVVMTAQQKDEWKQNGKSPEKTGVLIPNADARFMYGYDIVVRTFITKETHFNFVVEKSRLMLLPLGTVGVEFNFDEHIKPALAGGVSDPEIPASLTNEALKATYARAGKPDGKISAWIMAQGFDPANLSLENRIALDRKLQDIAHALEQQSAAAVASGGEDAALEQAVAAGF
jgi:hypothetical protein